MSNFAALVKTIHKICPQDICYSSIYYKEFYDIQQNINYIHSKWNACSDNCATHSMFLLIMVRVTYRL
jgi:hypothetical protein